MTAIALRLPALTHPIDRFRAFWRRRRELNAWRRMHDAVVALEHPGVLDDFQTARRYGA